MKRSVLLIIIILCSVGCHAGNAIISYGPFYKLTIPVDLLAGAVFFKSDSVAIKFSDASLLSSVIVDKDIEGLPPNFDIGNYPDYFMGLKEPQDLPENLAQKFILSSSEVVSVYGGSEVVIWEDNSGRYYKKCGNGSCLAFVINANTAQQVLMVSGVNFTDGDFTNLLKGF